jgi:hypothetical protein
MKEFINKYVLIMTIHINILSADEVKPDGIKHTSASWFCNYSVNSDLYLNVIRVVLQYIDDPHHKHLLHLLDTYKEGQS